nr:immunoglobulin heavy chain junction region [Mus musculus]NSM08432.1 immunoglobulin heavy chain junction region [Mus musculus]
CARWNYYFDYW